MYPMIVQLIGINIGVEQKQMNQLVLVEEAGPLVAKVYS